MTLSAMVFWSRLRVHMGSVLSIAATETKFRKVRSGCLEEFFYAEGVTLVGESLDSLKSETRSLEMSSAVKRADIK